MSDDDEIRSSENDWYRQRLGGLMFCVMTAFAMLIIRLFHLQNVQGEEFRQRSEYNYIRLQSVDAPRGLIFDRNRKLLADNRPSLDLAIVLKDARPVDETIGKLSEYTNIPLEDLIAKVNANRGVPAYKSVLLKADINMDTLAAAEVHKFDLPGISVNISSRRQYPEKESMAHVIGYVGEVNSQELNEEREDEHEYRVGDYIGKIGIEKSQEEFLRGTRGGRQVEVDAKGRVVRILNTIEGKPGHNVYLTIDDELQKKAEVLIAETTGAMVVMDYSNGEVLAMASNPSFDLNPFITGLSRDAWNKLITNPARPLENKAIQAEYPPASTYKIITAMAALEEGVANERTTVTCPGYYHFKDHTYRCWNKFGHGPVNAFSAMAQSCDVFFYHVGQKLGVDRIAKYAKAAGLGAKTGIELDHEGGGLIPTSEWKKRRMGVSWRAGETISVAIGQGYNLTTPLQMAMVTTAIANGGIVYRPTIIKKIETAEGDVVHEAAPEEKGRLPISPKTLDIVRKGLKQVVNSPTGTAYKIRLGQIEICGKTGTAQIVSNPKDDDPKRKVAAHLRSHAWFVGYSSSEKFPIAVSVIVEHGEHGSDAAAPLVRDMIRYYYNSEAGHQE
ncbi:MAG TPA: penicillin-binding protein 2, partial [Desulfobacteraceae bacterium]|nr:penicillin-binding protein 2 [Desulfobacteraceae bacterium]